MKARLYRSPLLALLLCTLTSQRSGAAGNPKCAHAAACSGIVANATCAAIDSDPVETGDSAF